ncbi:Uncharacterised protein [Aggregatibacter aphrophilus]|uniref:Uncharacterized protein n=1 Tax=Aggregatibacter aphrophilus TaxID=732 RepID=A0A336N5E2_AGGAP|nr:Uncharacterised protein [Aggregatibacter aphrophilus]
MSNATLKNMLTDSFEVIYERKQLKNTLLSKELVGLSLATLPNSVQGILYQAKRIAGQLKKSW